VKPLAAVAAALVFAAAAISASASDYTLKDLRIERPSARPTPPGARTGGAYFTVENRGNAADRLVRVASPVAGAVEIHSMTMDGNLMKMRAVAAIEIPAGKKVALGAGGYHVMLLDLKHALVAGTDVPLTLTFEKSGSIDVVARVEAATIDAAAHRH
jgi:copper(I)-binding protein